MNEKLKTNVIDSQYPTTLALLEAEEDDFWLNCLSSSSKESMEEHPLMGRKWAPPDHLGGDPDG